MNSAQCYVQTFYERYPGRAPVVVGSTHGFGLVYPFIFTRDTATPIGMVGMAWNEGAAPDEVQLYHISAFFPCRGDGSHILSILCQAADELKVNLYVQAEPQGDINTTISTPKLIQWYRRFGFEGKLFMTRPYQA
jgi:hypothetical protein